MPSCPGRCAVTRLYTPLQGERRPDLGRELRLQGAGVRGSKAAGAEDAKATAKGAVKMC